MSQNIKKTKNNVDLGLFNYTKRHISVQGHYFKMHILFDFRKI